MTVCAKPVRFVVLPLTVIHITVCVDQATVAVGFVVGPVALVHRAVLPVLDALTLSYLTASEPLTLVLCLVLQVCARSEFTLAQGLLILQIIIIEVTQLRSNLLHVHTLVVLAVARAVHPRRKQLMPQPLDFALGEPHSEGRLEAHNDPDLLGRVRLAAKRLRRVAIAELRLPVRLLTTAVSSHSCFIFTLR